MATTVLDRLNCAAARRWSLVGKQYRLKEAAARIAINTDPS
jgi:hypothetical protein